MSEVRKGVVLQIEPRTTFWKATKLYFDIVTGNKPPSSDKTKLFIPIPRKKVKALEKHFATNSPGEALVCVTKNSIEWRMFYPFGTIDTKPLRGTRIGERIHHAIVEHLADNYPNRVILHGSAVTLARRKQLQGMRIKPGKFYEIEAYRQLVRRHMKKRFRMKFER